jgi:RimJ/RimL family protein N-acetyltransferase
MPNFLSSDKIYFRPYEAGDSKLIYQWFNDPVTTYYMFTGQRPMTPEQIEKSLAEDTSCSHNVIFIVIDKKSKKAIGLTGLYEINHTARKAEMRIIIGEPNFRGKGYGTEIVQLVNYYGFDRLNLNRIYLGFTSANKGGENAYKNAGYVYEGTLKQDIYRNSQYYDSTRMAILRDDYYKNWYPKDKKRFAIR